MKDRNLQKDAANARVTVDELVSEIERLEGRVEELEEEAQDRDNKINDLESEIRASNLRHSP